MNHEYALQRRQELQLIIKTYEDFLRSQVVSSPNRSRAIEALSTRDIIRTVAMSQVSVNRIDRVTSGKIIPAHFLSGNTSPDQNSVESQVIPLEGSDGGEDHKQLFKNLKDCIPCQLKWDWRDFDWDRLKEILMMDLKARLGFLTNLEDLFKGNPVLDELCQILHCFHDLCPQDLLWLIAILSAFLTSVLDKISFNFDSALKDILSTLLRPYISGLEDFLGMYLQTLMDQIDCILNSIENAALTFRDLSISNTHGPDSIKFKKDVITGSGDEALTDIADTAARTRKFLHGEGDQVDFANDQFGKIMKEISRRVLSWTEESLNKAQDALIDLLGGEWLVTDKNLSWLQQLQGVATIIDIIEVIVKLGDIDDLCSEDNVRKVVHGLNGKRPGVTDISFGGGSPEVVETIEQPTSPSQSRPQGAPVIAGASPRTTTINFKLKQCLNAKTRDESALMNRWIMELTNGN